MFSKQIKFWKQFKYIRAQIEILSEQQTFRSKNETNNIFILSRDDD